MSNQGQPPNWRGVPGKLFFLLILGAILFCGYMSFKSGSS